MDPVLVVLSPGPGIWKPVAEWPQHWPEVEITEAHKEFHRFDTDRDGCLLPAELQSLAAEDQAEWVLESIDKLCTQIGGVGPAGLTFPQYLRLRLLLGTHMATRYFEAHAVEQQADGGGDKVIGQEGMQEWVATTRPAEQWDAALWPETCELYGADPAAGFGLRSFTAFCRAFRNMLEVAEPTAEAQPEQAMGEVRARWSDAFERWDVDSDGFLSRDETKAWAAELSPGGKWDDKLWPEMCAGYGADADQGLGLDHFGSMSESMAQIALAAKLKAVDEAAECGALTAQEHAAARARALEDGSHLARLGATLRKPGPVEPAAEQPAGHGS